jgi:hypothetical protein
LCAIGKRPVAAHGMAPAIRDVGRGSVDPLQRIEEAVGRAGVWIGTCRGPARSVLAADAMGCKRGAHDVAGEPLELQGIWR